jgi:integrase
MVAALSQRAIAELRKLPGKAPEDYVFAGSSGRPFDFRNLWVKVTTEARLPGRNFHQLRHGCGYALASSGVSQAQVMAVMGNKTLSASSRYMHSNVEDKRQIVARVFDHA